MQIIHTRLNMDRDPSGAVDHLQGDCCASEQQVRGTGSSRNRVVQIHALSIRYTMSSRQTRTELDLSAIDTNAVRCPDKESAKK